MRRRRAQHGRSHPRIVPIPARQPRQRPPRAGVVPVAQEDRHLEPDPGVGVIGQPEHGLRHPGRGAHEGAGGLARIPPDLGVRVRQGRQGGRFVESAQVGECPEGLHPRPGFLRVRHQLAERCDRGGVSAVQQEPLGGVALPAVGTLQRGDEPRRVEPVEPGDRAGPPIDREDPVDPPLLAAGAEVEPGLPVVGDPLGVLDDGAIHVGDPEGPVGPRLEHRRAERVVAGGQELAVRFVRRPDAAEGRAVGLEHHPVDQVVHGLADEEAAGEARPEEVVAVRRRAIGRGDVVGGAGVVESVERPADRIEPRRGLQRAARVGGREVRVAPEVGFGEDVMPAPVGVIVAEPVAPVVAVPAELGLPALRLERAGVGPEPEIAAPDGGRSRPSSREQDRPAAVAVGAVDPAVEAELEPVDPVLLVPLDEAREEDLAVVGLAVAVAVLGVEDVGAQATIDAIRQGITPVGNPSPSRKTVALS